MLQAQTTEAFGCLCWLLDKLNLHEENAPRK